MGTQIGAAKADQFSIVDGVSFNDHKNIWYVQRSRDVKGAPVHYFREFRYERRAAEERTLALYPHM
jgi:hypothetical protein